MAAEAKQRTVTPEQLEEMLTRMEGSIERHVEQWGQRLERAIYLRNPGTLVEALDQVYKEPQVQMISADGEISHSQARDRDFHKSFSSVNEVVTGSSSVPRRTPPNHSHTGATAAAMSALMQQQEQQHQHQLQELEQEKHQLQKQLRKMQQQQERQQQKLEQQEQRLQRHQHQHQHPHQQLDAQEVSEQQEESEQQDRSESQQQPPQQQQQQQPWRSETSIVRIDPSCDGRDGEERVVQRRSKRTSTISSVNSGGGSEILGRVYEVQAELLYCYEREASLRPSLERSRLYDFTATHGFESEEVDDESVVYWWVLRPSSTVRLVWDLMAMLLIGIDLLTIPMQLAFQPDQTFYLQMMFWFALIFWSCDLCLTFCTGYYLRGAEVLRPSKIARKYFRTWFSFDVLVIGSDLVAWFGDGDRSPALARMGKSLRLIRLVRSLRLLRLVKLRKVFETLTDHIDSEWLLIMFGITRGVLFILCWNHIIACAWYGVSSLFQDKVDITWIEKANFHDYDGILYKYLTSLHWSLTQFTPASMEVVPVNLPERLFCVVVLVFALVVFSSFVSGLTAATTQLRQLSYKFDKSLATLRKYLRNREISAGLAIRILRYVEYKLACQKEEVRATDVQLLALLSTPLEMELVMETFAPYLTKHQFFNTYAMMSPSAMQDLCNMAIAPCSYSQGDVIFTERDKAEAMLFVVKGRFRYFCKMRISNKETGNDGSVEVGGWVSEAALWTDWSHVGWMQALENSEVILLRKSGFTQATSKKLHVLACARQYAGYFVDHLNTLSRMGMLSDLHRWEESEFTRAVSLSFAMESDHVGPQRVINSVNSKQSDKRGPQSLKGFFCNLLSGTGSRGRARSFSGTNLTEDEGTFSSNFGASFRLGLSPQDFQKADAAGEICETGRAASKRSSENLQPQLLSSDAELPLPPHSSDRKAPSTGMLQLGDTSEKEPPPCALAESVACVAGGVEDIDIPLQTTGKSVASTSDMDVGELSSKRAKAELRL